MKPIIYKLKENHINDKMNLLLMYFDDKCLSFGKVYDIKHNGRRSYNWSLGSFDKVETDRVLIKNIKYKKTTIGEFREIIESIANLGSSWEYNKLLKFIYTRGDKFGDDLNILVFENYQTSLSGRKLEITILTGNKLFYFGFLDNSLSGRFINDNESSDLELKLK